MFRRLAAVALPALLALTAGCGSSDDELPTAVREMCEDANVEEEVCRSVYRIVASPEGALISHLGSLQRHETGPACSYYTDGLRHRTRRRVPGAGSCAEALRRVRVSATDRQVDRTMDAADIEIDDDRATVTFGGGSDRDLVRAAGGAMLMRLIGSGEWRIDNLDDESRGGTLK